jgi:two-component SAPR family response regulator
MNVIILEDEKLSAEYLANMLHRLDKEILVTHTFDTVKASVAEFRQGLSADLLFVDIHLADGISFRFIYTSYYRYTYYFYYSLRRVCFTCIQTQ